MNGHFTCSLQSEYVSFKKVPYPYGTYIAINYQPPHFKKALQIGGMWKSKKGDLKITEQLETDVSLIDLYLKSEQTPYPSPMSTSSVDTTLADIDCNSVQHSL